MPKLLGIGHRLVYDTVIIQTNHFWNIIRKGRMTRMLCRQVRKSGHPYLTLFQYSLLAHIEASRNLVTLQQSLRFRYPCVPLYLSYHIFFLQSTLTGALILFQNQTYTILMIITYIDDTDAILSKAETGEFFDYYLTQWYLLA